MKKNYLILAIIFLSTAILSCSFSGLSKDEARQLFETKFYQQFGTTNAELIDVEIGGIDENPDLNIAKVNIKYTFNIKVNNLVFYRKGRNVRTETFHYQKFGDQWEIKWNR